jgi:hypothetical protein
MLDSLSSASAFLLNDKSFADYEGVEQAIDNAELFPIAALKAIELEKKTALFAAGSGYNAFVLCNPPNLALGNLTHPAIENTTKVHSAKAHDILAVLRTNSTPAFVLLTNNILAEIGFAEFLQLRELTPHCLYIIQDYDCHHWYRMSAQCALLADIYVPAHYYTPPYVKLIATHPLHTIPSGSIQWSMDFLLANLPSICSQERPIPISGKHSLYSRFPLRNKLIATFSRSFPEVGFTDTHQFHQWTQEEKLRDWTRSSLHLIAPGGCDMPIRVFDALVTGGRPVVPHTMAQWLIAAGVSAAAFDCYGPREILEPRQALTRWLKNAKQVAQTDVLERLAATFNRFHLDAILNKLTTSAFNVISAA